MEITIDLEDSEPLFTQLMTQIKQLVSGGKLNAGDALPSIRQLANDLEVNKKTVAKAYGLLERDSIIQTKGYRGTYIHPEARENCDFNINEWVTTQLAKTIKELREVGVTDSEIRISFSNVLNNRNN